MERQKNNYYKLNCARCKICDTTLVSKDEKELEICSCKHLKIGGGLSYGLQRFSARDDSYEELSIYSNGYAVPQAHHASLPLTALDGIIYGKWFVQELRESSYWYDRMDKKRGQDFHRDDIRIGTDGKSYSARAEFSFSPVMGYKLYYSGMPPSESSLDFHRYLLDKVIVPFINAEGQRRNNFIAILLDEGFQDRTGMEKMGQNGWV